MENKRYILRMLPMFEDDLNETIDYISEKLQNPNTALKLVNDIETAILNRLDNPLSFEAYRSSKKRTHKYYRIYIRNFTVYYVVIDNVMEVRRLLYSARDINSLL